MGKYVNLFEILYLVPITFCFANFVGYYGMYLGTVTVFVTSGILSIRLAVNWKNVIEVFSFFTSLILVLFIVFSLVWWVMVGNDSSKYCESQFFLKFTFRCLRWMQAIKSLCDEKEIKKKFILVNCQYVKEYIYTYNILYCQIFTWSRILKMMVLSLLTWKDSGLYAFRWPYRKKEESLVRSDQLSESTKTRTLITNPKLVAVRLATRWGIHRLCYKRPEFRPAQIVWWRRSWVGMTKLDLSWHFPPWSDGRPDLSRFYYHQADRRWLGKNLY